MVHQYDQRNWIIQYAVQIGDVQSCFFLYEVWSDKIIRENNSIIQAEVKFLDSLGIKNAYKYPFFMSSAKKDNFKGGQNENHKIIKMINGLQILQNEGKSLVDQEIKVVQQHYNKRVVIVNILDYKQGMVTEAKQIEQKRRNRVIFVGNSCVGKSSLINELYGFNLKTAKLQTALGYQKVHAIGKTIEIYDSEGYNEDNRNEQFKLWKQLNQYKIIFILYQNTLKTSKTMIENLCKANRMYKIYFVRTKCDLWVNSNQKSQN